MAHGRLVGDLDGVVDRGGPALVVVDLDGPGVLALVVVVRGVGEAPVPADEDLAVRGVGGERVVETGAARVVALELRHVRGAGVHRGERRGGRAGRRGRREG